LPDSLLKTDSRLSLRHRLSALGPLSARALSPAAMGTNSVRIDAYSVCICRQAL